MAFEPNPLWYKDAIIYEVHVRTFYDSNGDGIGDFAGLTQKLDYLQDLGITAIWLLPFYPSPLRDDGYDIADYRRVHPDYGTLDDFKAFLDAAHQHGIRVITELVINHTSDRHPWFERARRAPAGSPERDFYVWSDTPDKYEEARIIFQDFETSNWAWDPVAEAYFWHRFYSHQPDLNFDNPAVKQAIFEVLDYWLDMGVDGMRLDAVPYLFEREGTNCENLPETHAFLRELRAHVDQYYDDRMLLAEANQWPEDAAEYFGDGDECHMNFHFPVMPRLYLALQQEDRFPIVDIMEQTPKIPDNCQWAIFLRNHDELTLEMVTDEERDFMYRAYAREARARVNLGIRRRLAPLMGNSRSRIELMNALLFALPGTPVLYYGDEIGMGDNIFLGDRNGVRTPMQWSGDRNAGFSRANPQQLYLPVIIDPEYSYETVNVEVQQANPSSLLWWTKRLLALRKRHHALARGTYQIMRPENRKVLVILREYEDEKILILANLSRFSNFAELDLSEFAGLSPVELFGRTVFPPIGELPYFITLGGHSVQWFSLEKHDSTAPNWAIEESAEPVRVSLSRANNLEDALSQPSLNRIEGAIADFLRRQRWFAAKTSFIRDVNFKEFIPIALSKHVVYITLIDVVTAEHTTETYVLPLALAKDDAADEVSRRGYPVVARLRLGAREQEALLYDAVADPEFTRELFLLMQQRETRRGHQGQLSTQVSPVFWELAQEAQAAEPQILQTEQSNTSVVYADKMIFKLFRKVDLGENLDAEIGRYLSDYNFEHAPRLTGQLDYIRDDNQLITLGIMQEYIHNEGDAWRYTLDELDRFYERVVTRQRAGTSPAEDAEELPPATDDGPLPVEQFIGSYLDASSLLGQRTAQLHHALGAHSEAEGFRPEPFSKLYQRSLYQSLRNLTGRVWSQLRRRLALLPEELRPQAERVLAARDAFHAPGLELIPMRVDAMRIRAHGDFHLGQVLYTGKDFIITDFEGEPARPLSERRIKRCPLRDVAGMLRSFHYAAYFALADHAHQDLASVRDVPLDRWARAWFGVVREAYIAAYREAMSGSALIPDDDASFQRLLSFYEVEKAVYELGYELQHRPNWVQLPLMALVQFLDNHEQ